MDTSVIEPDTLFGLLSASALASLVLAGAVAAFFKKLDSLLSKQLRSDIAQWLKGANTRLGASWATQFDSIFKRIFGPRHLSGRALVASFIFTIVFTIASATAWIILHPEHYEFLLISPNRAMIVVRFAIDFAFINILADYLILWKTRYTVLALKQTASYKAQTGVAALDLGSNIAILIFCVLLAAIASEIHLYAIWDDYPTHVSFASNVIDNFTGNAERLLVEGPSFSIFGDLITGISYGLSFYPALVSSVWLLFFVLSVKVLSASVVWRTFDIEGKPVEFIGYLIAAMLGLGYFVLIQVNA